MSGLLLFGASCQVAAPRRNIDNAVHAREDVAATQQQVRIRMRALIEPLSGVVIASADRIMAGTTNRAVRREALVWKLEAVPALREALFRPNPYVAAMDTWVLAFQMENYFESGPGCVALGGAAPVAVTTCQALAAEIERVAASLMNSGNVSDAREFARKWAGEHPIKHSISSRESTLSRVTERELKEAFSTQEVAVDVLVTLDDLSRRMDILSAQLLEQARWQAELFTLDQTASLELDRTVPLVNRAAESVPNVAPAIVHMDATLSNSLAVLPTVPDLITSERAAAIAAVHDELTRLTNFAGDHVLTTLTRLSEERVAAMRELREAVAAERLTVVGEMDRISLKVVDHVFWRAVQFFLVVGLLVLCVIVLLMLLVRRLLGKPSVHAGVKP